MKYYLLAFMPYFAIAAPMLPSPSPTSPFQFPSRNMNYNPLPPRPTPPSCNEDPNQYQPGMRIGQDGIHADIHNQDGRIEIGYDHQRGVIAGRIERRYDDNDCNLL